MVPKLKLVERTNPMGKNPKDETPVVNLEDKRRIKSVSKMEAFASENFGARLAPKSFSFMTRLDSIVAAYSDFKTLPFSMVLDFDLHIEALMGDAASLMLRMQTLVRGPGKNKPFANSYAELSDFRTALQDAQFPPHMGIMVMIPALCKCLKEGTFENLAGYIEELENEHIAHPVPLSL